jgi:hypothetical protein
MTTKLWDLYASGEKIAFSYKKKYFISYGLHLEEGEGVFSGKVFGWGHHAFPNPKDVAHNEKVEKFFYGHFPSKLTNRIWNTKLLPQIVKNYLYKIISGPFQWILKLKKSVGYLPKAEHVHVVIGGKDYAIFEEDITLEENKG